MDRQKPTAKVNSLSTAPEDVNAPSRCSCMSRPVACIEASRVAYSLAMDSVPARQMVTKRIFRLKD